MCDASVSVYNSFRIGAHFFMPQINFESKNHCTQPDTHAHVNQQTYRSVSSHIEFYIFTRRFYCCVDRKYQFLFFFGRAHRDAIPTNKTTDR